MQPNERKSFLSASALPAGIPAALIDVTEMLEKMPRETGWKHAAILDRAHFTNGDYARSSSMLDHSDFNHLFLDNTVTGREFGLGTHNLLQTWSDRNVSPSLVSIALRAGEHFGAAEKDKGLLAIAGILGAETANLEYHNAEHNIEVTLHMMRMLAASKDLSPHQKVKGLIAAMIHDLGNDGRSNKVDGVHRPLYLEKQSVEFARPYLEAMGMDDEDMKDVETMILGTDVTPFGSPDAPATRVAEGKNFPSELSRLEGHENNENKAQLLKLTRMLAIADIASSTSLHLEQAILKSWQVANEINVNQNEPLPQGTDDQKHEAIVKRYTGFLKCCGKILGTIPEAVQVYGDNHKEIQAAMLASVKNTAHM